MALSPKSNRWCGILTGSQNLRKLCNIHVSQLVKLSGYWAKSMWPSHQVNLPISKLQTQCRCKVKSCNYTKKIFWIIIFQVLFGKIYSPFQISIQDFWLLFLPFWVDVEASRQIMSHSGPLPRINPTRIRLIIGPISFIFFKCLHM